MSIVERLAADRARFAELAAGMKTAGEPELARKATYAAQALAAAAQAIIIYQSARDAALITTGAQDHD